MMDERWTSPSRILTKKCDISQGHKEFRKTLLGQPKTYCAIYLVIFVTRKTSLVSRRSRHTKYLSIQFAGMQAHKGAQVRERAVSLSILCSDESESVWSLVSSCSLVASTVGSLDARLRIFFAHYSELDLRSKSVKPL
jgi:hypothetical protein